MGSDAYIPVCDVTAGDGLTDGLTLAQGSLMQALLKPASDGLPAIEAGLEEDILMSTQLNQEAVPDDLKARVERTRSKLVLIDAYVTNLKARVASLEIEVGQIRVALGEANRRFDHLDTRMERLERHAAIKPPPYD